MSPGSFLGFFFKGQLCYDRVQAFIQQLILRHKMDEALQISLWVL